MAPMYAIIWRYQVKPEAIEAFTAAYGREGEWARLFWLVEGFLGTELYRGAEADDVFITIDRWLSRDRFTRFMQRLGDAYAALDERLAGLRVEPTADQARYLTGVMRLKLGDEVLLFNGHDGEWKASLVEIGKRGCVLTAETQTRAQTGTPDLELIVA